MSLIGGLHFVAPVIGFATLVIGACAVLRPQPMSLKFGIAASDSALPYVVSTGIRDVFIGLTVLILFYFSDWRALGAIHLCIGLVAVSDFLVVRKAGDRRASLAHLVGAIGVFVYGTWLLCSAGV